MLHAFVQKSKTEQLSIAELKCDDEIQQRVALSSDTVRSYAQEMSDRGSERFPPVIVFRNGENHWIADGFHRVEAAKQTGIEVLNCEVLEGTVDDAKWYACCANAEHGLRRTNADKKRAVKTALTHPLGVTMSDSEIARHVRVSDKTVAKYRRELELTSEIPKSTKRVGADGRQIETAKIGSEIDATEDIVPTPSHELPADNGLTWEDIAAFLREQTAILGRGPVVVRLNELATGLEETADSDGETPADLQVAQPWTEPIEL